MRAENVSAKKTIRDGVVVVLVEGVVVTNLGSTNVHKVVSTVVEESTPPRIILNLEVVNYLDSYSFGWIMKVYKEVKSKDGDFVICSPNEDVRYLFEITDFTRVVPAYETEDDALAAILSGEQGKRIVYL